MSFVLEPTRAPSGIGNIVVMLKDVPAKVDPLSGSSASYQSAHFQIEVTMTDGTISQRRGNLVPHLAASQVQGLQNFMSSLRVQAASQILAASA